jgi:acyl dehydratase
MIWWEDFRVGDSTEMGRHTFSEEEILGFGRQFDPQPFHADAAAAGQTVFGGLIASGWHTCAVGMRLMVQSYLNRTVSLGSPGIDEIRWLKPVRPGDTLAGRLEILEVRPSRSKPDRGIVRARSVVVNQDDVEVLSFVATLLFKRRPEAVWSGSAEDGR